VRRSTGAALSLATLVPIVAMLVAVSTVPRSAYVLPTFEFASSKGPVRVTAAELGARRDGDGLEVDQSKLAAAIARLQTVFNKPPLPASYELKPDHKILLKGGTPGVELDAAEMRALLLRALRGSRSNLKLPLKRIPSTVVSKNAIVVTLKEFRLDLYKGSVLVKHFPVGVGALRFPTPPGAYYVRSKAMNPTWRNPGSGWSRGMPAYIPPGPRNPLGTRALRLDRGALVIHGTPQPWTIGTRSSHGCIRMRRPDVEQLFDLVPEQTPVFIVP
jgi:lipoprotein-anchoring transpeptidase ErfK/SrfK